MEKRVLLAISLCIGVLLVWYRIFPPPPPPMAQPAAATITQQSGDKPAVTGASGAPTATQPVGQQAAAGQSGQPGQQAAVTQQTLPQEETVTVERPGLYKAVVTSYGAALKSYELLNKKYYSRDLRTLVLRPGATQPEVDRRQTDGPTNLVTSYRPAGVVRFPNSGFTLPPVQAWTLRDNQELPNHDRKLVYHWESQPDGVSLDKTLIFAATTYQVAMTVDVKNTKATPIPHHFQLDLEGFQDPTQKPGGMFSARVPQNQAMWDIAGKMKSLNLQALQESVAPDKLHGDLRWIGIGQQYFILAAAMQHGASIGDKQGHASAEGDGAISLSAEYGERVLPPGASVTYQATLYAGPKLPEQLDEVQVNGVSAGLSTAIDFTLEFLARPLLWILRKIYDLVGSWALSIVLLTLLIKLVLLYPSHRSMQSMKAMGNLKPEIDALKLKCGEDKQRFNMELMALYKKHGVNPVGGCLPMVIQMPIYFALYSMLGTAVELYRAQFYWIHDLTAADPYFVLPLVTGGLMFLQSKLTPPSSDPQQKMMASMMPAFFTLVSIFLPAGLTLYIMTNTLLGMMQQYFVNRSMGTKTTVPAK